MTPELDPDRQLALAYVPLARKPAIEALWRLDVILGSNLVAGRELLVSRLRLAWWREALERLDLPPPPDEPLLRDLARLVLNQGVSGGALAAMADGWEALLSDEPLTRAALERYASSRGGLLFRHSGTLLGADGHTYESSGVVWALVDFARRSSRPDETALALNVASDQARIGFWPVKLRPLGMLAATAAADVRKRNPHRQGSPSHMLRMLWHRLTGR